MCIPGLGENRTKPQYGGSRSISVMSGSSSRSVSPGARPATAPVLMEDRRQYRRRTASKGGATDSNQMASALFRPPTPEMEEVQEEPFVEERAPGGQLEATPFFTNDTGVTLIKGGTVVNHDKSMLVDVLVENGKIAAVGENLDLPQGATLLDARDKFVIPGGIDTSTHFYRGMEGDKLELADDWASGTKAALAGGTTMVVDLVIPERGDSLLEAYKSWREAAEQNSSCDFALSVAVPTMDENTKGEMEQLSKELGVNSFKLYMSHKGRLMLSNSELVDALKHVKDLGCVAKVHCENGDIILENRRRLLARGVFGPEGHPLSQPLEVEEEAVSRACSLALQTNVPLVICSPSSPEITSVIKQFRRRGLTVLGEALGVSLAVRGSHYYNKCWSHAAAFITSPPLRDEEGITEDLVAALRDEEGLDMVASEHKGISQEQRAQGQNDFTKIPQGVTGVEERMAVVWEMGVQQAKMDMERFVEVTSAGAAKLLNVFPRKGCIAEGSDADIVVWNPHNLRTVNEKTSTHATDFNVLEGITLHGAPEFVICGGKLVVAEYQVNTTPSSGQFVECSSFPSCVYDRVHDTEKVKVYTPVERAEEEPSSVVDQVDSSFGLTTPRGYSGAKEVFNKQLGIYQRPVSAHGVRNQQDSTFSLSGSGRPRQESLKEVEEPDMVEELVRPHTAGPMFGRRATVRVNEPPGGKSGAFW